jgi:tricorn protease
MKKTMKKIRLILLCLLVLPMIAAAQDEARLLRFPAINGDKIIFTYAGDLYTVSRDGGMARKLTNHEGFEMFAKFSPDGKQLAFTAQYDGNTEVYVMPAEGGVPVRLTYTATLGRDDISDRMGPNNIVMTWTPDGKNIIYRSRKQSFNDFIGQLYSVPVTGGLSAELPLSTGGFCSYSPDGTKLAFNRVMREFRTWKYYKGGMADDIRIFDFVTGAVTKITDNDFQDIFPMWHGDNIYFLSDRDRTMNLFVYNTGTRQTRKLTNYTDYDVKFPSIGNNAIIYENGGYLYVFDLVTEKASKVNITIAEDFYGGRNELKDASKSIANADISPDGKRVVFSARGDVFSVPAEEGITRNLTASSGAHDREAVWSPDGKYIAYLSDKTGEYEIYIEAQDGSSPAVQLTSNADTYKFTILWSPDSKKILWSDKKMRLQYINIDTKEIRLVDKSKIWEYNQFGWSPDSRYITYRDQLINGFGQIMLFDTQNSRKYKVTDEWYSSSAPTFSTDGKYLLFASERDFNPIYSETEWNHAYQNMERIYMTILAADTPNPFAPKNDEVEIKKEGQGEKEKGGQGEKEKGGMGEKEKGGPGEVVTKVDTLGLGDRIISLPVRPSNYFNINEVEGVVYYNEMMSGGDGISFKMFDLKKKEESELGKGMIYSISYNGKKMLVSQEGKFAVIDLPSSKINLSKFVDVSGMKVYVNKDEEWKQIYDEAWRQMRDFFYVENMHGVDWPAIKEKYGQMLPYVNNRNDLNYLIGEMIAELSIGHAYVNGGDKPAPERITTGLLGAKISKDASGYFKVDKILKGENWNPSLRSPLTEVGVNVKEGDFILAVDGKPTDKMPDIYAALQGKPDKPVELTVNSTASLTGSRKVLVTPIADEASLYYYNWVQHNIDYVNSKTNGQVGYLHIPDMGSEGLNEFVKYFYPQLSKKALIIDDRGNGGGNVSPMIIERLRRQITMSNMARNVEIPSHTPHEMMLGPMVLLINQYSASDGDLFPYAFEKHHLGTVIGVRTWGGVVGIRGSLPFIDGMDLRKPEFASYSSETSDWIIEGHGVDPDIVIDNDPAQEYKGIDAQLDKAIEVISGQLKDYKDVPPIPVAPDKSK